MSTTATVAFLLLLAIHEGGSVSDRGVSLRCRCINKERRPIGRHIASVEVYPANSHCVEVQIIATLKKNKQRVCLDPEAPWVRRVLKNRRSRRKP